MNIVYFVLSNSSVVGRRIDSSQSSIVHMQVGFSIRTMLAQIGAEDTIYVATDTPTLYCGMPQVVVIPINDADIQQWRGPHDFFWRVKIVVIQKIAQLSPDKDIMYLDGDTYLYGRLDEIKQLLAQGVGMMHKDEGANSDRKDNAFKMWHAVKGHQYGEVTIDEQHMYNAGVVAIPATMTVRVADMALEICDGMLDDHAEPVLVEQYALSVALNQCSSRMVEARKWIGHYWHYKYYWSLYISKFFARSYRMGNTVEDNIKAIRRINLKRVHHGILIKRTLAKFTGRIY
jgi:hypothetical protein